MMLAFQAVGFTDRLLRLIRTAISGLHVRGIHFHATNIISASFIH
jgi:hypothetical protein